MKDISSRSNSREQESESGSRVVCLRLKGNHVLCYSVKVSERLEFDISLVT